MLVDRRTESYEQPVNCRLEVSAHCMWNEGFQEVFVASTL